MGKTDVPARTSRRATTLKENGADAATADTLASRLKDIVEGAARTTGAARAFLLLYDAAAQGWETAACYGRDAVPASIARFASRLLVRRNRSFHKEDLEYQETLAPSFIGVGRPTICLPVIGGGAPRGVLAMRWAGADAGTLSGLLPFLQSQAHLCGVLLESAEFQRELARKEEQVQDLIRDTLNAQEAERERVCLEVHDGVAQTLASAFQYLQILETTVVTGDSRTLLVKATSLVKQAIQESRDVINSLQPATLMDLGLVATLRQEMQQLEQETGWKVDFDADNIRLSKGVETGLYRLIHEAITNAKRHSRSRRLRVGITSEDCRLKVEVRDWGVGFFLPPVDRRRVMKRRGTGLLSMRKRAELLQGTCVIETSPGEGTAVRVEIPLDGQAGERQKWTR